MAGSLIDWLASLLNQRVVDELKAVETVVLRSISKGDAILAQMNWQKTLIEANQATGAQSLALIQALYDQIATTGSVGPEQLAALTKKLKDSSDELNASITKNGMN